MIILITGLLLIIVSILFPKVKAPYLGFAFVFLIMGFQEGVQGDYMEYKAVFQALEPSLSSDEEPLWDYLSKIFHPLGWYFFVILLTAFQCGILSLLSRKFVVRGYRWISPILFFFWFGMMLLQMKAMRQALAIEICLIPFIIPRQKPHLSFLSVFLPPFIAYFFHNSCLVLAPVFILYYLQLRFGIFSGKCRKKGDDESLSVQLIPPSIVLAGFIALYVAKTTVLSEYLQTFSLLISDFRLSGYMEMNEAEVDVFQISPLIVIADAIFVFACSWFYRFVSGTLRIFIIMAVVSCFFDVVFFGLGSLPRIGYYYLPAMIVVIPDLVCFLRKKFGIIPSAAFIVFSVGYALKTSLPFMLQMDDDRFGTYKFMFIP